MKLSKFAAQAEEITLRLESLLKQRDHVYFDFKGVHHRVKRAVIKAYLTPLFTVHQEEGYDDYDPVRFANTNKSIPELYAIARKKYIDEVNAKYKVRDEEREKLEEQRIFQL